MMSPVFRWSAAFRIAPAEPTPPKIEAARTPASGAMPTMPRPLRSPPNSPKTAVP
jgi:hypothetical protein